MFSHLTLYGKLNSISLFSTYPDNRLKDCVLSEKADMDTPLGVLTPQYEHAGIRRKHTYSVSFFQSGKMRRIALNEQTNVETSIGKFPAELITFYESGSIKKLFPLNGQLSAYWDEDDEYNLAQKFDFSFPFGSFNAKIIGIGFYENGATRSLTLWPKDTVIINTPLGEKPVRIGFSLYPGGSIKSFEPAVPVNAMTPIGKISAFDVNANGITGDRNSLNFNEDGSIKSLITSSRKITVTGHNNIAKVYSPMHIREMYEHEIFFQTLKIDFEKDKVRFNEREEYKISESRFTVEPYVRPVQSSCSDCSGCKQCDPGLLPTM